MKTFIDCLLEKKGLQSALPFWKLKITDDELKELIEYIQSKLTSVRFDILSKQERKQRYKEFDRELCLMYALWWNRSYSGGRDRWEQALKDFSIHTSYLDLIKEAVAYELKYHKRLNIPLFYGQNSVRIIDSVLAQGGLPMKLMSRDGASSSYENFLFHLISEYEEIDEHDWQKIDRARDLADRYLSNRTLRESGAILDFSMEIVKSCIDDDNRLFDSYQEIKKIIENIKKRKGRQRTVNKIFKANWAFRIIGNQIKLLYSLDVPEIITRNDVVDYLSFYLEDCLVGYYQKRGENTYIRMPQTKDKGWKEWNRLNKGLSFKKKTTNGLVAESLLNSEPPFIGEPILLQYHSENLWSTKSNGDGNGMGCLFTKQWYCPNVTDATELNIDGESFMWKELSFVDLRNHPLCFRNETTQEEITLDGSQSPYFFSFSPISKEWIESSSKSVLMHDGDVRSLFKCYQDDEPCNRNNLKFYYKTINNEYIKYTGFNLPEGTIYMKVVAPDGHSRTFSFFNINDLSYNHINQNTIQIRYGNGTCVLMAEQNVEESEDGTYQLIENENLNGFAPIWFRLYPRENDDDYIGIGLRSPLQQSCFFDSEGRILPSNYFLSINELNKFHINLEEPTIIKVSYYSTQNNRPIYLVRKEVRLPKGRYPLDVLKEDVERLFWMFGFDDYRKYVSLRINRTNEIKIRRYTYLAQEHQKEDGTFGLFVTRNGEAARDLQLFAFAINASEDLAKMDNNGDGHFYVPINNAEEEFVVFSNDESMLPYYLNTKRSLTIEERNQNKRESIEHIHKLLESNDEKEWNKFWRYMEIVIENNLPYSHSFNCFQAIANDPYLLASFLVRICSFNRFGEEVIIYELQRMEKDLSFGFHYLPLACWQQEKHRIEAIYDNIPQSVQEMIGEMDVYVSSNFHYLKALLERRFGNEGIFIEKKLRLGEMANPPIAFNSLTYYKEKIHNAFEDFDAFNEEVRPSWFTRVELPCNLPRNYNITQLMQYMAIVLPQCAAQYAHGADLKLWNYNPDTPYKYFIRRMINYMSVYVPEAYNELFAIALLREPVNQIN